MMAELPPAPPGAGDVAGELPIKYINFNQLRSFFAVAENLSFTRAARSLNVGQPTITTQVKALEEHYGVELFQRLPGKIALSEAGDALLVLARRIFELEDQAVSLLEAQGEAVVGTLRVGSVGPFFVMKLLAAVREAHPNLAISLRTSNSEEILRDVLDGRLDVAVVGDVAADSRLTAMPVVPAQPDRPARAARAAYGNAGIRLEDARGVRAGARRGEDQAAHDHGSAARSRARGGGGGPRDRHHLRGGGDTRPPLQDSADRRCGRGDRGLRDLPADPPRRPAGLRLHGSRGDSRTNRHAQTAREMIAAAA
jgi:DNA-binding transcriptional LysR family regulator